jgi:hypothetical protein
VNGIIAETGLGRQEVVAAIDAVQACRVNPSAAQGTVSQVVNQRQQSLAQLRGLEGNTAAVAAEHKAIRSLVAVLGDSIQADQDYAAWMGDVAAGQPTCHSDPMNDANFAAGQAFSAKADADKEVFVEAWNPLAAPAGLTTHQAQDF